MTRKRGFVIIFISFILFLTRVEGQWITLNSGTSTYFSQVFFSSDDIGYLLGENGNIYKTTNGGFNWSYVSSSSFISVCFIGPDTGYGGSYGDGLYKTVNGGLDWNKIALASDNDNISSFSFTGNKDTGYCAGSTINFDSVVIYKTTDRGKTWSKTSSEGIDIVYGFPNITFTDAVNGYMCDIGGGVKIYNTSNGSFLWNSQYEFLSGNESVSSIHFPAPDTGYAVGGIDGVVLKTTDAQNWQEVNQTVTDAILNSVWFTSPLRGFAVGGNGLSSGVIIETSDGGINWQLTINNSTTFRSVHFPSKNVGYACGANGLIMKYTTPVGSNEYQFNSLTFYPNPSASGNFHALFMEDHIQRRVDVYNAYGKQVNILMLIKDKSIDLNLTENAKGIYFVKITEGKNVSVSKLVYM